MNEKTLVQWRGDVLYTCGLLGVICWDTGYGKKKVKKLVPSYNHAALH